MSGRLIGVDVGGTKTALATLDGNVLSEPVEAPTVLDDAEALLDDLVERIGAAGEAAAVGLAIPSMIEWETGRVRFSVNIPLQDVPVRRILEDRLGCPVFVDNDASCAALAEAIGEEGEVLAGCLVMLTVGTGVGGGIIIGGRVFRGATGAAAELGHMIVAADLARGAPAEHRPPRPDSLEALAAGRALDALARERGLGDGRGAVDAARRGDPEGQAVVRLLGERLGVGIANLINTLDPDVVAIGGGVSAAGELLLEPAREAAMRLKVPGSGTATQIRLARHGPEAGVRGAALLAAQELSALEAAR